MDLEKLDTSDYVIAGSAFVFLITMFLPWWGIDFGGDFIRGSYSNSGFDYFLAGWLTLLIAIVMVGQIVLDKLLEVDLPEIPIPWGTVHLAAGGAAAVIVLLRVIIPSSEHGVDLDRKYGVFIALLAAIGLAVGGFLKFQQEQSGATSGGTGSSGTPTQF